MFIFWKRYLFCLGCLLLVAACQDTRDVTEVELMPSLVASPPAIEPSPSAGDTDGANTDLDDGAANVITAEGIGVAKLGMSLGELKQQLGPEVNYTVQPAFMSDFDAIAVTQSGDLLFYILYLSGEPFTDTDIIQGLLTQNPIYQTSEGIGVGTTIADAEAAYGDATLSYNTSNESREYVRFERQPAPNLSFATGNANQAAAGTYSNASGGYNETKDYKDGATIESILVVCLSEVCGGVSE